MYTSCDVGKQLDRENGILHLENYDYSSLLGVDLNMDKKARICHSPQIPWHQSHRGPGPGIGSIAGLGLHVLTINMMSKRISVQSPEAPPALGPYSQAVAAGGFDDVPLPSWM